MMFCSYPIQCRNSIYACILRRTEIGHTMQETLCQTLATMNFYLNVNDVSELLGVQRETIYRYCKENFLPHVKIGNNIRSDPTMLAIWIQEHEFAARGNVTDKITDWVVAHVLD